MTEGEYNALKKQWQRLYRRRRKLRMELDVVQKEMDKIEKELR